MKKIRMCFPNEKTFREGFEEYILDCKARNLRDGTINHYQESIKQIYLQANHTRYADFFDVSANHGKLLYFTEG